MTVVDNGPESKERIREQNREAFQHWVHQLLRGESVVIYIDELDEDNCDAGGIGGVFDQDLQPLMWAYRARGEDFRGGDHGWEELTLAALDLTDEQRRRAQALASGLQ